VDADGRASQVVGSTDRRAADQASLEPLALRAADVARLLGLGRSTVYQMLAADQLPTIRVGRAVRVPREALQRWIDARTEDPDAG
jgi:excisionase family DNA binding protein